MIKLKARVDESDVLDCTGKFKELKNSARAQLNFSNSKEEKKSKEGEEGQ